MIGVGVWIAVVVVEMGIAVKKKMNRFSSHHCLHTPIGLRAAAADVGVVVAGH